jgi:hypothetical protein
MHTVRGSRRAIAGGHMALHPAEEGTLRAFVTSDKRDRLIALLSSRKRRKNALASLNHFASWNERCVQKISSPSDVFAILSLAGAPPVCHIIADDATLDGSGLPLPDAVAAAEACWFASVLCGLPGQIAFYFDEVAEPRVRILLRHAGSAR